MKPFKSIMILSIAGTVAAQDLESIAQRECMNYKCDNDYNNKECVDECINQPSSIASVIQGNSACIQDCNDNNPIGNDRVDCIEDCIESYYFTPTTRTTRTSISWNTHDIDQDIQSIAQRECMNYKCDNDYDNKECVDECINQPSSIASVIQGNSACIQDCNDNNPIGNDRVDCIEDCIESYYFTPTTRTTRTSISWNTHDIDQDIQSIAQRECMNYKCDNDYDNKECVDECINQPSSIASVIQGNSACIQDCNDNNPIGNDRVDCIEDCIESYYFTSSTRTTQTQSTGSSNTATTSQPTS
ncbi:hypothetical protein BB560_005049, partial [Smittium megazygosporum]